MTHIPANLDGKVYSIVLPCAPNEFADFISRLLGRPQTIQRRWAGSFSIDINDVRHFFSLICQRVSEQNNGSLVSFECSIDYSDGTTITLHGLNEVERFSEMKPILSTGVTLSFVFLVTFSGKAPEKQNIVIHFSAPVREALKGFITSEYDDPTDDFFAFPRSRATGFVYLSIEHTSLTWGNDIYNLLTNAVIDLFERHKSVKNWFWSRRLLAFSVTFFFSGVLCIVASISILSLALSNYLTIKYNIPDLLTTGGNDYDFIKLNAQLALDNFKRFVDLFMVVNAVLCMGLAAWFSQSITDKARRAKPSFVVLSRQAEKYKANLLKQYALARRSSFISFWVSVIASIVGSALFTFTIGMN